MKKIFTFLFALFFISLCSAQTKVQDEVKTFKLKNGLTVYLVEDKTATDVFGYIVTKGGAKEDPKDSEGIAHYLEHMLFKGTQKIGTVNWEKEKPLIEKTYSLYEKLRNTKNKKEEQKIQKEINEVSIQASEYVCQNELDKILKEMGGTGLNANTSLDRTVYFNSFPAYQLEKWLDVYSERFVNPVFRGFQAELEVVFEEKNMSLGDRSRRANEALFERIFKGHEYARTVLGRVEHIKKPSLNKMKAFFDTYYVPNNMCLVLAGNINTEKALAMVKDKFSRLKRKELPKETIAEIKPFKGREKYSVHLGYSNQGTLVYRTVPANHPDANALKFVAYILSNRSEIGMFDKLRIDNDIRYAGAYNYSLNDYGVFMISYAPKIDMERSNARSKKLGRWKSEYESFSSVEKVLLKEVKKLKNGDFPDWKIDAAKKVFKNSFIASMETSKSLSLMIGDAFQSGETIKDMFDFPNKIDLITKADIIRVANKYLGKNYLSYNVYTGKPKNKKIDKPSYDPIEPKVGNVSEYAKKIEAMPLMETAPVFVDYKKDFVEEEIKKGVDFYYAKNPKNHIFSLKIKYGIGNEKIPDLKYASTLMNYSGTLKREVNVLKEDFAKISCNYSIYSNDNNMIVNISGDEKYLKESLKLMTELLLIPKLNEDKLEIILRSQMGQRNAENYNPAYKFDALKEYVMFGDKSSYIDRKSIWDLKSLTASGLVGIYQHAIGYGIEMHYCGSKPYEDAKEIIKNNLHFKTDLLPKREKFARAQKAVEKDQIYFVNDRDAIQSKIFIFVNGEKFTKDDFCIKSAFNNYYSGGFSGLVMQEVREKRSLAYSAGASYRSILPNKRAMFLASTSTQADKTVEAVKVFVNLIKDMPEKAERIDNIKKYLVQSSSVSKPDFRNITGAVSYWHNWGLNEDPSKIIIEKTKSLSFDDILSFYKKNIKNKKIAICILGNKRKIDMKGLKTVFEISTISKSKLFGEK